MLMNLWGKLKKQIDKIQSKTVFHLRTITSSRKSLFRWTLAFNITTILLLFLAKSDEFNLILTKQTQFLADAQIPPFLRPHIYRLYSKYYEVNTEQIELPLKEYPTFSSFFIRRINRKTPQQRPNTFASPCDGKILAFSQVRGDTCQIVKGATYSLSELVLGETRQFTEQGIQTFLKKNNANKLYQMVIYLAPGDYHRFHSPTHINILKKIFTPGLLDTVKESSIAAGNSKYDKNARLTMFAQWKQGLLAMVMVGALNVSRIHFGDSLVAKRGEELGYFNLGSTIVLVVEAKEIKSWKVRQGDRVKYGEELFEYVQ